MSVSLTAIQFDDWIAQPNGNAADDEDRRRKQREIEGFAQRN
jgi:hypothetical protein